ncbi:ATP-binding protein [Streptomyces sp. NPDC050315]|uniref:ATP-binding protein n=1 Tax=Streptomyces sp. NPDC050315 TaxID=3155039 RepID=UPI00342C8948
MRNAHAPDRPLADGGYSTFLGPGAPSVREARDAVRTWLAEYGLHDAVETAELLVSELATNAVLHARSRFRLTLTLCRGVLRCEVADQVRDAPPPGRAGACEDSENGRGLFLVDALSERWGSTLLEDGQGKCVWFELAAVASRAVTTARWQGTTAPDPEVACRSTA